jgi:hypothetical protein
MTTDMPGGAPGRSDEDRAAKDVQYVLMRIVTHPARNRISAKSQNEFANGAVDFASAGNRRDSNSEKREISGVIGSGFLDHGKCVRYSKTAPSSSSLIRPIGCHGICLLST